MTAAAPAHSTLIGGSTAARLLACPGSYELLAQIPDAAEPPSVYAEIGSAEHEAAASMIIENRDPRTLLGAIFNGYVMKAEHVIDLQAIAAFVDLVLADGAEFLIEERVRFPDIDDAFGTVDFAARRGRRVTVADWKFGRGVPVPIAYADGQANAQLLFYATALRATVPEFFDDADEVELVIVQPGITPEPARIVVAPEVLDDFAIQVQAAVVTALAPSAPRQRGDHCRFAACKTICPLHTGPLLDFARLTNPKRPSNAAFANLATYGEILATGLALADLVEQMVREYRAQAHALLSNDGAVPGWKLVRKRATRQWQDADRAAGALLLAGYDRHEIFTPGEMLSPARIETLAKASGRPFPRDHLIAASSGTTLARADDARNEVPAVLSFSRALNAQSERGKDP